MAILNQRDARVARARLGQIGRALANEADEGATLPAQVLKTRKSALLAEQKRILGEIETYSRLTDGDHDSLRSDDLGLVPILARVARGLSQKEFAVLLGVQEQQIQRYESDRYSGVSLSRYEKILKILEVEFQPKLVESAQGTLNTNDIVEAISPALLRELRKREWLDLPRGISVADTHATLQAFEQVGHSLGGGQTFHRRTLTGGSHSQALALWRSRVLQLADNARSRIKGRFNISDTSWLSQLVRLSVVPDGPRRAIERLREFGIITVIESHLPQTHLDGAAFLLRDGIPVVGLTLRHDRIDNFWFTLLHELGHIYLHFNHGLRDGFLDDVEEAGTSNIEQEADLFAQANLIADEAWKMSPTRFSKSKDMLIAFARSQNIHPAIVAGRIRRERDYTLFADMLGRGQIRSQLMS